MPLALPAAMDEGASTGIAGAIPSMDSIAAIVGAIRAMDEPAIAAIASMDSMLDAIHSRAIAGEIH